jgi:hypothetical protein
VTSKISCCQDDRANFQNSVSKPVAARCAAEVDQISYKYYT